MSIDRCSLSRRTTHDSPGNSDPLSPPERVHGSPRDANLRVWRNAMLAGAPAPGEAPHGIAGKIIVPWFALGFVAVAGVNSFDILPRAAVGLAVNFDTLILAMAMAALGLTTRASAIRLAGIKPLALAALLFGWLLLGGATINAAVTAVLR